MHDLAVILAALIVGIGIIGTMAGCSCGTPSVSDSGSYGANDGNDDDDTDDDVEDDEADDASDDASDDDATDDAADDDEADDASDDDSNDDATDDEADDDSGQTDLNWVSIPGGTFQMGCVPQDTKCYSDESPRHEVTISAFSMTATEITQKQYVDFWGGGGNPSYFPGCSDCPVDSVTWSEADEFCRAVGGRLPTEAEWEYAARAGTETNYICGDDPSCLETIAWWYDNSDNQTHSVASKTPNNFGLYDMTGNVWEWVNDWYNSDYYSNSPGHDPQGPSTGEYRVLRGGAWFNDLVRYLRASYRHGGDPGFRDDYGGLRCARDGSVKADAVY